MGLGPVGPPQSGEAPGRGQSNPCTWKPPREAHAQALSSGCSFLNLLGFTKYQSPPPRGPSGPHSPQSGLPGAGRRQAAFQYPGVQRACPAAHKYHPINMAGGASR